MMQVCKRCSQSTVKLNHKCSESEEEYEGNYEVIDPNVHEDKEECIIELNVEDVANALASEHLFGEPSFIRTLDIKAMNAPKFPEYANTDGEFVVEMEFHLREFVIKLVKYYTLHRGVDCQDGNNNIVHIAFALFEALFGVWWWTSIGSYDNKPSGLHQQSVEEAYNLPVTSLVKTNFYRLNELFTRKRAEGESRIRAGHVFSKSVTEKIQESLVASGNIMLIALIDRMTFCLLWKLTP
ncbi:hypothetical protein AHAS_Ahas02G0138000 [Arachis hypogaea]